MTRDQKIVARVSEQERQKYLKLGGSRWLRSKLEEACAIPSISGDRPLLVVDESECGALEALVRQSVERS